MKCRDATGILNAHVEVAGLVSVKGKLLAKNIQTEEPSKTPEERLFRLWQEGV
jgi:hypothetical protein